MYSTKRLEMGSGSFMKKVKHYFSVSKSITEPKFIFEREALRPFQGFKLNSALFIL
jgi:hypothetical protein